MDEMDQAEANMPATRGDLSASMAMLRGELQGTANALRGELQAVAHRLAKEIVKTQGDIREIREAMTGLATKDDVNRILGAIDSFAGKAQNYDRAAVLHGHALTELDFTVKDHEGRIKKLESGQA